MKIEQLPITEYDESYEHDPRYLVFQVYSSDEGLTYDFNFPCPNRGLDREIDFDSLQSMPYLMLEAMLGREIENESEVVGKFFRITLPEGVLNG